MGGRRLFVGRLPPGTTRLELLKLFSKFGGITLLEHLAKNGIAFVTFATIESAQRVLEEGPHLLHDVPLNVTLAQHRQAAAGVQSSLV